MDLLSTQTEYAGFALLCGFFAVILWKILAGAISLDGLLDSFDEQGHRSFSPARAQLLIFTILVAGKYVLAVSQNPHRDALPGLPDGLLAILGGSQAVYVAGKAWSAFVPKLKQLK
jgi:hypothetical protein